MPDNNNRGKVVVYFHHTLIFFVFVKWKCWKGAVMGFACIPWQGQEMVTTMVIM